MGAESFLKEKRKQAANNAGLEINVIAPYGRHNVDQMGGYNMPSGQFTGNGPDGVLQPGMPTQRRMAANGKPYMADEGEVVVVDAQTIKDYGGAQALDSFLQQHRPQGNGQQQPQPQQPQAQQQPQPQAQPQNGGQQPVIGQQQLGMLQDVRNGVEQFQQGGVPTRDNPVEQISRRAPSPMQRDSITPNRPDYTEGNITPNRPRPTPDPVIPQLDPLNVQPLPGPAQVTPTTVTPELDPLNIDPTATRLPPTATRPPYQKKEIEAPDRPPYQQKEVDLVEKKEITPSRPPYGPEGDYVKDEITPDRPPPYQEKEVDYKPPEPVAEPGKAPVISPTDYDEMLFGRYASRMGAMSESERAAEAQRGMQAGLSDQEAMARGAISDVGRRAAVGEATGDFAIDAARRAEERAKYGKELSIQEKQFEFQKEQFEKTFGLQEAGFEFSKDKFAQQLGLSKEQFDKQFGLTEDKWDYSKGMDIVNALLSQGGLENYDSASTLLEGMFGTGVDFTNALQAENLQGFNTGWNNMNDSIAAGMSFEDWLKTAEADGTLDDMNMTNSDLESMYGDIQKQNDPLYQLTTMTDGWVEQGLMSQEEADNYVDFMTWSMTHPEGFNIQNGYQITDKSGNEVGFFTDQAEADAFMEANKDKEYNSNFVEDHFSVKDEGPGTTGDMSPNEVFEDWKGSDVPAEYKDEVTYDKWVAAGKPETWEEYEAFTKENPDVIPTIQSFTEKLPDNVPENKRHVIKAYSEEDQAKIIERIEAGDKAFVDYYAVPENSTMHALIEDSGDKVYPSPLENLDHSGKYITYKGPNGATTSGVIWGTTIDTTGKKFNFQRISVKNPKTGEITVFTRKFKK